MKSILDRYLDRVLLYANRPESESEAIRQELKDHLSQKVDDLAGNGLPREEAILETLRQHVYPTGASEIEIPAWYRSREATAIC